MSLTAFQVLDFVTTGGTLTATDETIKTGIELLTEANKADDSGDSADSIWPPAVLTGSRTSKSECCPKFQIVGDFILNTNTGRVWKYDNTKKAFIGVTKKPSPGRIAVIEKRAGSLVADINSLIKNEVKGLPQVQRAAKTRELQARYITPINDYLKLMK